MKEIVAPNYVRHMPGGVDFRGHEGYKKHVLGFITPFPDLRWNMDIMVPEEVVRTLFNSMANALANNDRVEIRGFGTFKIKHYDGYTGKNPKTGKPIKVKPKKLPFFKCGNELKDRVDIHK